MEAMYYEGAWVAKVQIIANLSDDEIEKYKLKIVETTTEDEIIGPKEDGLIFDVEQSIGSNDIFELIKI